MRAEPFRCGPADSSYAELCLASDYLERPSRHRRGPELALRVGELAPGSQQALRLEQRARRGGSLGIKGPRPPSPQRTQLYDARLALATAGDPRSAAVRADAQARAHPGNDRLAVLAETLTAPAQRAVSAVGFTGACGRSA